MHSHSGNSGLRCLHTIFQILNSTISNSSGACVDGDFSGSAVTCDVTLNTTEPTMYKYASCPDVDECGLGIHDCNANAECLNTHGSFV
jgi:hypothetical protein